MYEDEAVLEYRILGPLHVQRDGAEAALTAPKLKQMLLVFLLRPNEALSADQLIDAMWGDDVPESARKIVQVYVSQLRATLGAEAIQTVAHGYRLAVAPTGLDAGRFERMREDGRQALLGDNPDLALALARRALALWRGPALVDVAYEPFAAAEAARLDELRVECTEDELDAELALGRHEEVVPALRRLCAEHPLRERTRQRLALALYRCGRQAEALEVLTTGRQVMIDELGLDPSQEHRDLEHAILNQDPALDGTAAEVVATPRLPAPSSALVGRQEVLEQLSTLVLRDDVRIVTLSGAGGSGKTRVALELARSAGSAFANGAAFVELASIQHPDLVLPTIAKAVGVPETPEQTPAEALARWLQGRDLLLVVDNVEHVIDSAGDLAQLVRSAPRLTLLVTSRRVLHISGEHVFPLLPLPVDDAVQLFCVRAAARDRLPDAASTEIIAEICRRLDCLPLAVELAAARSATLSPQLLLQRLSDRVTGLGVGPRDAPARQKTLMDTLRWSTDLLTDDERRTLARLSVFAGGSSIEAAEAVCEADLETLATLIDWSLLQRTAAGGEVRLSMLETIREHAAQLLDATGDSAGAEARHASYYTRLIESTPVKGPGTATGLKLVDVDLDNLRAAMDRSERAGDDDTALQIASALYHYYYLRGLFREGRDRISGPLQRGAGSPALQAFALKAVAGLNLLLGDLATAKALALRGIDVGTASGTDEPVLGCHTVLSLIAVEEEAFADARAHLERSEAIASSLGLDEDVVVANTNLGELALAVGDLDEARRRWEYSLSCYGDGDESGTFARLGLGAVSYRQGLLDEAAAHFTHARTLSEHAGWLHNTTMALVGLAAVAADQGDHADAALLLGRAAGLLDATGGDLTAADQEKYSRAEASAIANIGAERFAELFARGRAASP